MLGRVGDRMAALEALHGLGVVVGVVAIPEPPIRGDGDRALDEEGHGGQARASLVRSS